MLVGRSTQEDQLENYWFGFTYYYIVDSKENHWVDLESTKFSH